MRLTTRTNLAMRVLMFCAVNPGRIVRKHEIAEVCNASENHLAQVIHTLAQKGYVDTQRGRAGGMRLARDTDDIRVGELMRTFEGVVPFAECFDPAANTCPLRKVCLLRDALSEALEAFYAALDRKTLTDLVQDNGGLEAILRLPGGAKLSFCAPGGAITTPV